MRSFLGFGQKQYIGVPQPQAVKLAGISSVVVPLLFQWISYGASTLVPNINVLVDMDNAICRSLEQIRSVYIDNLGSDVPVYVYFPDTEYSIVAKPNSEGWYPAFTNQKKIWVVGEGFLTNNIPQTFILVSNARLPPAVNVELDTSIPLWKASPTITRGTSIFTSGLGIPALGDQTNQNQVNAITPNASVPILSQQSSGFYYLTGIFIYSNELNSGNTVGAVTNLFIESTGVAGILYAFPGIQVPTITQFNGTANLLATQPIYQNSNMQLKLDATQLWRMRNEIAQSSGAFNCICNFTFSQT